MPAPGLIFTVEEQKANRELRQLFDEWEKRIEAIVQAMPQRVAAQFLELVQGAAPRDIDKNYPKMLEPKTIVARGGWEVVGVIPPGWAFSQRLRGVDVKRTVLYVRPKTKGGTVVSEAAVVLSRHNPWTMDTLPYEPTTPEAAITARRVSEREVRPIEHERRHDLEQVIIELKDLGVPLRPKEKVTLERRVSRDLAFEILRREFGFMVPAKAHWIPAVQRIPTIATKEFKELFHWFAFASDKRYTGVRDLKVEKAGIIKRVQKFQDLVAPR